MSLCAVYYAAGGIFIPLCYMFAINTFYDHRKPRDYAPNIRRRFLAAALINVIGISTTFFLLSKVYPDPWRQMGFRSSNLFAVAIIPTLLTLIFYVGTLATMLLDGTVARGWASLSWRNTFGNIRWIRMAVVAPISEELSFRACTAPLLRHCFEDFTATFVAPISFSLLHLHHIRDDLKQGTRLVDSLANRGFQVLYTYLFGIYATYIFFGTGHILAPILCHSICNLLELPSLDEVPFFSSGRRRAQLYALHFGGFIGFALLAPFLINNDLYN